MILKMYQADAFTSRVFGGNPAAVCLLEEWLPDPVMQQLATENNLSETAFCVRVSGGFALRWFTPEAEIDLCGHATLATAFVLYACCGETAPALCFQTMSGLLTVRKEGDLLQMDFPSRPGGEVAPPQDVLQAIGAVPTAAYRARDLMLVFGSQAEVERLTPDLNLLAHTGEFGVVATAPGEDVDFVSRYFVPSMGVGEDPVTGSSHCTLIPYWAGLLKKHTLTARQVSRRGGELFCELRGDRVFISGKAVLFATMEVFLPDTIL